MTKLMIIFYGLLARLVLRLHFWSYSTLNKILVRQYGHHPKEGIIRYGHWFQSQIDKDEVVVDIGSNRGTMAFLMAEKAKKVYGIELELAYVRAAQRRDKNNRNIEFFHADATTFDYAQLEPIDVATLSNVLEHIEFRVPFLKKLATQIKWANDLRFLIRVPLITRSWVPVFARGLGEDYRLDPTHFTEYTVEEFEDEIRQADLMIKSLEIRFGEIYAVIGARS